MRWNERVVLVTGGARGIGRACVEAFAGRDAKVVLGKALLERYSGPEEIAEAVLFLASPAARSVTGQVLLADNGRSLA